MSNLFPGTSLEVEQVLIELFRQTPAWRKLEIMCQMNQTVHDLALDGLKLCYPKATPEELHRRLAELLLGPELAERAYSPPIQEPALTKIKGETLAPAPIAVTLAVTETLDKLGVPYLIGGSFASSIYGVVRTTVDADILADLKPDQAVSLTQASSDDFYISAEAIRDAIRHRSYFNVVHLETIFKVDIFIPKTRPFDRMQFKRRKEQVIATNPYRVAYVASAEDTVLAKLEWYRLGGEALSQHWRDALGILKVQEGRIDIVYLRTWADKLGVADLLEKALIEAER